MGAALGRGCQVADRPHAALDSIRNQLQVILMRTELCQNSAQCEFCARAVSQIIKDTRSLEEFVKDALER